MYEVVLVSIKVRKADLLALMIERAVYWSSFYLVQYRTVVFAATIGRTWSYTNPYLSLHDIF